MTVFMFNNAIINMEQATTILKTNNSGYPGISIQMTDGSRNDSTYTTVEERDNMFNQLFEVMRKRRLSTMLMTWKIGVLEYETK